MNPVSETEDVLLFVTMVDDQPWQRTLDCLFLLGDIFYMKS